MMADPRDSSSFAALTPAIMDSLEPTVRAAVTALQDELVKERERAQKFEGQIAVLSSNDPSGLYSKYINMETTTELLKEAIQKALEEKEMIEKQYNSLQSDFNSIQMDLASKEETLAFMAAGNDAAAQLVVANSEVASLKLKISELDSNLAQTQDERDKLRGEYEDLRGENANLKNALSRADVSIISIRNSQNSTAPRSVYSGNNSKESTEFVTTTGDEDATDYRKICMEQLNQITALQDELKTLEYLKNPDDQYSSDIASLNYQVFKLYEDNKRQEQRISELSAQKAFNDTLVRNLEQELIHLRSGVVPAGITEQTEMNNLHNKLAATELELHTKTKEFDSLQKDVTTLRREHYALQEEMAKYKKMEHDMQVDISVLNQQLAKAQGQTPETDALQTELTGLRQLSGRLEKELLALRKALGTTGITGVEIQLKRKDLEIERLRSRVEKLLNSSAEPGDTIENLSRRLVHVQEDLNTKEQLLSEYENHMSAMHGMTPAKIDELTAHMNVLATQNNDYARMLSDQGREEDLRIIEEKNTKIRELEEIIKTYKSVVDSLMTANVAANKEISQTSEALMFQEQAVNSLAESFQKGIELGVVSTAGDNAAPVAVNEYVSDSAVPNEYRIPDEVKQSTDPQVLLNALLSSESVIIKLYEENESKLQEIEQLRDALKSHEHAIISIREASLAKDQEIDQLNDALAHQEKTVGSLVATLSPKLGRSVLRDKDGIVQMGSPIYDYSGMPPSEAELEMLREAVKHAEDTIAAMREANASKDKEIEELNQALALQEQTVTSLCQTLSPSFTSVTGLLKDENDGVLDNRLRVAPETLERLRDLEVENEKLKHDLQLLQQFEKYLPGGYVYEQNAESGNSDGNLGYLLATKDVELANIQAELQERQSEVNRLKEAMFAREEVIAKVSYFDANKSKEIDDLHEAMRKQEEIVQNLCASLSPDLGVAVGTRLRSVADLELEDPKPRYNMEELIADLQQKITELVKAENIAEKDAEIDRLKRQLSYQENPLAERTAINELIEKEAHIKKLQDVIERQDGIIENLKETVIHRENEINNMANAKRKIEHIADLHERSEEESRKKLEHLGNSLAKQEDLVLRLLKCISPSQREQFFKEEEEAKKARAAREEDLANVISSLQAQLDQAKSEGGSTKKAKELIAKASGKMMQWFKERPTEAPPALDLFA